MKQLFLTAAIAAAASLSGSALTARADTITVKSLTAGSSVVISGIGYRIFTYTLSLSDFGEVKPFPESPADNFQFTNIPGFFALVDPSNPGVPLTTETVTGASATQWTVTAPLPLGPVTGVYNGNVSTPVVGPISNLVSFSFLDTFNDVGGAANFVSNDHSNATGAPEGPNIEIVRAPSEASGAAVVPLPTAAWAGTSLLALLGGARLRRRATASA